MNRGNKVDIFKKIQYKVLGLENIKKIEYAISFRYNNKWLEL